jgi:hypothetical protein
VYGTPELTDDWSTININDVRLSRLRSEAREEGTILWFTLTAPMTIFDDDSSRLLKKGSDREIWALSHRRFGSQGSQQRVLKGNLALLAT